MNFNLEKNNAFAQCAVGVRLRIFPSSMSPHLQLPFLFYILTFDDPYARLSFRWQDLALEKLVFRFDGDKIDPESTPQDLDMEDDDCIDVNVKE